MREIVFLQAKRDKRNVRESVICIHHIVVATVLSILSCMVAGSSLRKSKPVSFSTSLTLARNRLGDSAFFVS